MHINELMLVRRLILDQPPYFSVRPVIIGIIKTISLSVLLLNFAIHRCYAQVGIPQPVRIMFYNVENLFDIFDDPHTDDNAFLPDGLMRWNSGRYKKKINSVYKVIIAAGEWDPPAVIAFCEVENRKVLEDLVYGTYLSRFNYSIIHEESPDRRGIDVCLVYRKKIADIIGYRYLIPSGIKRQDFNSRSVLYAKMLIGSDTIHLFVNHWPSRRGGVLSGEDYRLRIADMVREKVDSIIERNHEGSGIIIAGDFNCNPDDKVIKSLINSSDSTKLLINLSDSLDNRSYGTYRYMGTWEMIDQVIVSRGLLWGDTGIHTEAKLLRIFRPDFLLKRDPEYPGFSPFSTYRGYRYQGGYSDHLPVLLDLTFR